MRTGFPSRALLAAAVSFSLMSLLPQAAQAQPAPDSTLRGEAAAHVFDIPAQPLPETLTRIARESGQRISLDPGLVQGLQAPPIRGRLNAEDAIRAALAGTSLELVVLEGGTLTVKRLPPRAEPAPTRPPAPPAVQAEPKHLEAVAATRLDTVNVVGGRTGYDTNTDLVRTIDDAQAYYMFDSEILQQSAAINVEDFLRQRLSMNTMGAGAGQQAGAILGNTSQVNLRGLGTDKTLILINGRRMSGTNLNAYNRFQTDLNAIPMSAIDRIEVLPSSASGIYGGGAMGGVVNVILKKDYNEREVGFSYETPGDTDASIKKGTFVLGETFEDGRTRLMITGQRTLTNQLRASDRDDVFLSNRDRILANHSDFLYSVFSPYAGNTPNIGSFSGNDLVLKDGRSLGAPITHVSPGTSPSLGAGQLADMLLANAGRYNLQEEQTPYRYLAPYQKPSESDSLMVSLRRKFGERVDAFVDFYYDHTRTQDQANVSTTLDLPASSPGNPFTEAVRIRIPRNARDAINIVDVKNRNLSAGLIAELPRNWTAAADFTYTESAWNYVMPSSNSGWLLGGIGSGALNPLADLLLYPQGYGGTSALNMFTTPYNNKTRGIDAALRANGDLFELPWGMTQLAVGLTYSKEKRGGNSRDKWAEPDGYYDSWAYFPLNSSVASLYAEATIPLVERNRFRFMHALELQLAARHEKYIQDTGTIYAYIVGDDNVVSYTPDDNGQPYEASESYRVTTPTIALKYQPHKDLILRASYAEAFLPPSSSQLARSLRPDANPTTIDDPVLGQRYDVQTISGGNPDLTPLESQSWTAGLVYKPETGVLAGWRFGLEYYNIVQNGVIGTLSAQEFIDYADTFPGRVVRDPDTGLITLVDRSTLNLTQYKTRGWDATAEMVKPTDTLGVFGLNFMATLIKSESRQLTLDGPFAEYAGHVAEHQGPLKIRGNLTASWEIDRWLFNWSARYYHKYFVGYSAGSPFYTLNPDADFNDRYLLAQGSDHVASQTYHDVMASYRFPEADSGWLDGVSLQFGIKNLFDRVPPLDVSGLAGWVSGYGDMRLRTYYLNVRKKF